MGGLGERLAVLLVATASARFVLDESFPDLSLVPAEVRANFSNVRCVAFDGHDLHAVGLGSPPILTFSGQDGAFLRAWGADALVYPHGCVAKRTAAGGELWVADSINDPVHKRYGDFTVRRVAIAGGALLGKLGVSGVERSTRDPLGIAEVTDVAWDGPDLRVSGVVSRPSPRVPYADRRYVADGGDGNGKNERVSRVDGATFAPTWIRGTNGTVDLGDDARHGGFLQLHSVTVDTKRGRLWLADRGHGRVVALDAATGAFLGDWPCVSDVNGAGPNAVRYDQARDRVVVTVGNGGPRHVPKAASFVFALDAAAAPGDCAWAAGSAPVNTTTTDNAHEIDVDAATGDVYVAFEDAALGMPRRYRSAASESDRTPI